MPRQFPAFYIFHFDLAALQHNDQFKTWADNFACATTMFSQANAPKAPSVPIQPRLQLELAEVQATSAMLKA